MAKKENKTTPIKTVESQQKTNTGIWVSAGAIEHSEYDTKDWTELQKDYYKMRNSDALLSTTVDMLKYPILMAEYRIEGPNTEVNDYVKYVYDNLVKGFQYFKYHKLLALDFGLSMHEVVIKRGARYKGKLTNYPVWFNPIQNETINQFHYNDETIFTGIQHEKKVPEGASSLIEVDSEDLEWFTYNEEYNDIRGRSIYRPTRIFWDSKHKVLKSKVTSTERGVMIPLIKVTGEPSQTDQASIEQIGRTICQMKDGYVAYNSEKIEVDKLQGDNQQDIIPLLDYLDRQLFFNTLTQFMTSGIGQNGSRAATEEHKTAYEMVANYILQLLETNIQLTTDKIVKMSSFANIPEEEMPEFHFNSISTVDMEKTSLYMKTLVDAGLLTKDKSMEEYVRETFGLPEAPVMPMSSPTIDAPELKKMKKVKERKLTTEQLIWENEMFALNKAEEHFETVEEKTERLMNKVSEELFKDIKKQLKKDRKKRIQIDNTLMAESIEWFMDIWSESFEKGQRDVKLEAKKEGIVEKKLKKLEINPKVEISTKKVLHNYVKKYFFSVKSVIENQMEQVTNEFIQKKGGLNEYLDQQELEFKKEKLDIKKTTEKGYVTGRGETLIDLEVETFFYSARLDKNLCDECAKFDGDILTKDEVRDEGLMFRKGTNPFCLGGVEKCRCLLLPFKA